MTLTTAVSRAGRLRLLRAGLAIGLADGVAGLSFGAVSRAAGLTLAETMVLGLLMVTGSGKLAFVGTIGTGGGGLAAVGGSFIASCRNAVYSVRLVRLLPRRGRLVAAQWVMDETAAAALGEEDPQTAWWAFCIVGACVYVCVSVGTLAGALLMSRGVNQSAWGLDAVNGAVFLGLMAGRLRDRGGIGAGLLAGAVTVVVVPFVPKGVPAVVAAAVVAVAVALRRRSA